jgi:hypothetical protein
LSSRRGFEPFTPPGIAGWRYEPGDAFLLNISGGGFVTLALISGLFTVLTIMRDRGGSVLPDVLWLGFMWFLVVLFAMFFLDSRRDFLMRRHCFIKYSQEPKNDIVDGIKTTLFHHGIAFDNEVVFPFGSLITRVPGARIIRYQFIGVPWRIHLEQHWRTADKASSDHTVIIVGPTSVSEQVRIVLFLRSFEGLVMPEDWPSLVVYGGGREGVPEPSREGFNSSSSLKSNALDSHSQREGNPAEEGP